MGPPQHMKQNQELHDSSELKADKKISLDFNPFRFVAWGFDFSA